MIDPEERNRPEIKEGNKFLFSPYYETVMLPLSNGHIFSGGFFNSILEISNDFKNYKVVQKFDDKSSKDIIEIKNNILIIFFHQNKIFFFKKNEESNLYVKDDAVTKKVVERKDHKIKKLFNYNSDNFGIIYDNFIDIYSLILEK